MIPKPLRDRLGLLPGPVEVTAEGSALRVEPLVDGALEHRGDRLVIPATGLPVDDETVEALRRADQR